MHPAVALARPGTTGPGGFRFAEARMAELLGAPTLLVDPHGGPAGVADGLVHAATHLDADAVVLLDVGGDVLAHGDEPGLASPLADAVLLAAAPHLRDAGLTVLGAVLGAGCDGELTPDEVGARLAEVAGAGGDLGTTVPSPAALDRLAAAVDAVPTEASLMALRCARGERGAAAHPRRPSQRAADRGGRTADLVRLRGCAAQRGPPGRRRRRRRLAGRGRRAPGRARRTHRARLRARARAAAAA